MTWVFLIFVAGSSDRVDVLFNLSYQAQIHAYWVLVWVLPVIVGMVAYRVCVELVRGERVEQRPQERRARSEGRDVSDQPLTVLAQKLAEAHGLALAAIDVTRKTEALVDDVELRGRAARHAEGRGGDARPLLR